jgi:uncharacterized protein DUF4286
MNEPGFFLLVRFWVAPQAEQTVLRWLDGGHVAELLRRPGFLWCKRIRLTEKSADGWAGYSMIYAIDSKESFDAYEADQALKQKFARERKPFEAQLRIERVAGQVA